MGGDDDKIVRIPGETLTIKVSSEEEAYRKKYLPDAKKLTDEKLVCTVCSISLAQNIHKGKDLYVHRALQVLVCEACYNFYGDGCFSADEDGDDKYCRWCGQGGTLFLCSACNCAFCQKCTKQNLKASVLAELENDDWKCYICNPRPLFGCRTICWGAQQLNQIGKEKEQERLKKVKERLEKLEAKKKEANERKSRKASSSEDEVSSKKRKRSSDGDSSSPEVMPKRRKREARVRSESRNLNGIGRRKKGSSSDSDSEEDKKTKRRTRANNTKEKIVQSSSEDDSDGRSKRDKLSKKKKKKGDSDDSSDTSKKKSKRRSAKKKDSSDEDSSDNEKSKKKKPSTKKKGDSTDSSSDEKKKKKKTKKKKNQSSSEESSDELKKKKNKKVSKKKTKSSSDVSSDEDESSKRHKKVKNKSGNEEASKKLETVDSDSDLKKTKNAVTDSEELNTMSAEDILVRKRIKLAILWLSSIVKDISELGTLISLRATKFSKKKINTESLKSYEDVLNCVNKIKQLISGVHSNYDHIEKTLESHLKPWKILVGLEDSENGKNIDGNGSLVVAEDDSKDKSTIKLSEDNETSQNVELNGSLDGSKVVNTNEEKLNAWSDDSDDQNETRALISKVNESLDKSQIEDLQSETDERSALDKTSESTKKDSDSVHEESNTGSHNDSKESQKILSEDNEDQVSKKSSKAKKGSDSDSEDEKRSPENKSKEKNKPKEIGGDKSQADVEGETSKEELKAEGDKEDKRHQSDQGHGQDSSEEDCFLQSFASRLKDKWQSAITTEEMNLKNSPETDSSDQGDKVSTKKGKGKAVETTEKNEKVPKIVLTKLDVDEDIKDDEETAVETTEKNEKVPKIVLTKLDADEGIKDDEKTAKSSKKEQIKRTKSAQSEVRMKREEKAKGLSSDDEEAGDKKTVNRKSSSKHKMASGKSNCLTSSDEEEVKKSMNSKDQSNSKSEESKKRKEDTSKSREDKEKERENRRLKRLSNIKKIKENEMTKDSSSEEDNKKNDKEEKSKDEDVSGKKPDRKQEIKLKSKNENNKSVLKKNKSENDSDEEGNNKSSRTKAKESKGNKEKDKKGDTSKTENDRKKSKLKEENSSDEEESTNSKKSKEKESKNGKEKDKKGDDSSKTKNNSRKSKLKEDCSDEEEITKSKKIKVKESKDSKQKDKTSADSSKIKKSEKSSKSNVGLDSSDDEKVDTSVVENGADIDNQENTDLKVRAKNGLNDETDFKLELQVSSTENTNDVEMVLVEESKSEHQLEEEEENDESEVKEEKTKFIGLDSSSDEEIKVVKKKESPKKKRPVRKQSKPQNPLVLSSDEEEDKVEKPTVIESSDEDDIKEEKDEDFAVVVESSADSSDSEIIQKSKRKKKGSSDSDASISEDNSNKKKKRRRIKCADSSDESGGSGDEKDLSQKGADGESPAKGGRKNIKKIKKKGDLQQTTIEAAEEEKERRKRIEERQKLFNQVFELKESAKLEKLVLDFDPESKKELISVNEDLVAKMKPHQAKGVKFMWDSCFESVKQIKKTKGSGCILAHCMGLGKTFQVISLVHTLLTNEELTKVRTVMVVCPLSTVLNWVNEFGKWLEDIEGEEIEVFHLTKYNKNPDRARELRRWQHNGGVLVMGYEMFRNLTNEATKKFKAKMKKDFLETLIDPGADLIVCDEGHMLKNEATALSKAMTRVRTLRRIVLTGTPMQNNLKEYHCMVQFVKPNLLGTSKEFLNRFVNPINNGQFVDSTDHDVKLMKRRAHVLHKMLEGLVQRFDYNVLTPFLPPKQEYVISVCLSELQEKLYTHYLDNESQKAEGMKGGTRLFMDWQTLGRVWTHPRVLKLSTDKANWLKEKKAMEESDSEGSLRDFIDDDSDKSTTEDSTDDASSDESGTKKKKKTVHTSRSTRSTRQSSNVALLESSDEEKAGDGGGEAEDTSNKGDWWCSFVEPHHFEDMRQSGKLMLLFAILKECEMIEDKVLVFSQSLFSLDLIEYFLDKIDEATQQGRLDENLDNHQGTWSKGLDYFRLDGSTSSENRNIWCKAFNREDNPRARLFLISTRAGGLGINLTAANRVIIFDASWNPSHDIQSIFRIYRFGQKKACYVYRFVAFGTMEEKVYERQVAKQSISNRVVDEQQVHRHFSMNDLTELYTFTPASKLEDRPTPALPRDPLMTEILSQMKVWIEKYHEHDSLLENVIEEELNEEERKAAWEDYENDKKRGFLPPAGPQGPSMNPNAAWNQQIEIMRQQLKLRYADKSDDEINSILVYQVSLLMRQQQQQQMQMAAQMQAANNMGYRPQMYANNMMGGFNQRPQMQTTAYLRNIAPKPSTQQPNYTPDQVYRMQQQANLARLQLQQMTQQQKAKPQQQQQPAKGIGRLLNQQLTGNYPTANIGVRTAADLQRMKQNYEASRQAKPGVTITEIFDDKPSGSSES